MFDLSASLQLLSQYVLAYAYEFDDPDAPGIYLPPVSFPLGAYHAADVQYLFDIEPVFPAPSLTEDQLELADAMVSYWTHFARFGNPNGFGTPFWPPYETETDEVQSLLAPTPETSAGFAADHMCDFWAPPAP